MDAENKKRTSDLPAGIWEIAKLAIISLAIVLPIRYFIAQPFIVRGASMEPNFNDKDYLVVDEVSYYFREPMRGEPIVFRYPKDKSQFFIKRIIGLPGETIEIREGGIRVVNADNPKGFWLEDPYQPFGPTRPEFVITLAKNEYFVLGDNRQFSSDSRVWGPLPDNFIVGRAVFRVWPVSKFGVVPDFAFGY